MNMLDTIEAVIDALGGDTAVAKWLDISQPAVANWKVRGHIPRGWHYRLVLRLQRMGYAIAPEVLGLTDDDLSSDPLVRPEARAGRKKAAANDAEACA